MNDWQSRVRIVLVNGHPADMLTLASEAPSRRERSELLLQAARALIAMRRPQRAWEIFDEALALGAGVLGEAWQRLRPALDEARESSLKGGGGHDRVVVGCGHMIDSGRSEPRFPPDREADVRSAVERVLRRWKVDGETLALCGGARGSDILLAEASRELGARVRLYLALPEDEFVARSVRMDERDSGNWLERFHRLRACCETYFQHERLGASPTAEGAFARNNRWMIEVARSEARTGRVLAVLVWDGEETGDGEGGTADFARSIREVDAETCIIHPLHPERG